MNSKITSLKNQFESLIQRQVELRSGTVVSGSYNGDENTISVSLDASDTIVTDVKLNAVSQNTQGFYLIPENDSYVVIATIDGAGEWFLVRTSNLQKVVVLIGSVSCEIDGNTIRFNNDSDSVIEIEDRHIKINTSTESLYTWLKDLLIKISAITVPTGTGVSGLPNNSAEFNALISRLGNLLSS